MADLFLEDETNTESSELTVVSESLLTVTRDLQLNFLDMDDPVLGPVFWAEDDGTDLDLEFETDDDDPWVSRSMLVSHVVSRK